MEIILIAKDEFGNTAERIANSFKEAKYELDILEMRSVEEFETFKQKVDRYEDCHFKGIPININQELKKI